ncbi:MAG: lysylphosphatidylglycerol synthase domain-containing protein [Phycisphaeraceae bacterium]
MKLSTSRAWLWRNFTWIAGTLTVFGIALLLIAKRNAILDFDWSISKGALTASLVLLALAPLIQGATLWVCLRYLRVAAPFEDSLLVWTRGFLMRYAPSGALQWVYRFKERDRLHASRAQILAATGYEQLVAFAAAGVTCLTTFVAAGVQPPLLGLLLSAVAIGVAVAVRPGFLGQWLAAQLTKRGYEHVTPLRGRRLVVLVCLNLVGWVATSLGVYALVAGLSAESIDPFFLAGAFALAWMVGFLMPGFPGGIGSREAVLIVLLTPVFGLGPATTISIALRLVTTLAEFVAIGLSELYYVLVRSRRY